MSRSSVKRCLRKDLSGRGVKSGSHGPLENSLRPAGARREHADKRVLPMPASPVTKTSRPTPERASERTPSDASEIVITLE